MLHAISTTPIYAVARTVVFPFFLHLPLFLLSLPPLHVAPSAVTVTAVDTAVATITATAVAVAAATSGGGVTLVVGTRTHPPTLLPFAPSLPLALPHLL